MCGYFLAYGASGHNLSQGSLDAISEIIQHRGPDSVGFFNSPQLAAVHRRLKVIDLTSGGHQPMRRGDWIIVYNGEVYNYRELRDDLLKCGLKFVSRSDTEVVLAAVLYYGLREAVCKFNGMFSFVILNTRTGDALGARDRYGQKPLYIWENKNKYYFSSEVKALFPIPEFKARVNKKYLQSYFCFQNSFDEQSMFDGVRCLAPASIFELQSGKLFIEKYWDFNFVEDNQITTSQGIEISTSLLEQSVLRMINSDVAVGSYLSGGLDSSLISLYAQRHINNFQTFTAGFKSTSEVDERSYDERALATAFADAMGMSNTQIEICSDDLPKFLKDIVWHIEDPCLGMSYANYLIARFAAQNVTVCLAGVGGDELFAGYPWRYYVDYEGNNELKFVETYFSSWQRLTDSYTRAELFRGNAYDDSDLLKIFSNVLNSNKNFDISSPELRVNTCLYFEAKTFLPSLLKLGDKLAMASGLEERFPFLDNELVDFISTMPVRQKIYNLDEIVIVSEDNVEKKIFRGSSPYNGKNCLRAIAACEFPTQLSVRKKQGFTSPDAAWFRLENSSFLKRYFFSELACADYLDPDVVRRLVLEHIDGKANRRLLTWSLLMFEEWCRVFIEGEKPIGVRYAH